MLVCNGSWGVVEYDVRMLRNVTGVFPRHDSSANSIEFVKKGQYEGRLERRSSFLLLCAIVTSRAVNS